MANQIVNLPLIVIDSLHDILAIQNAILTCVLYQSH